MTEIIEAAAGAVDSNPAALIPLVPTLPAPLEAPADVVTRATEQANVLMDIVESKKLYADIQGKKYLTAEAWETILAFNNVSPREVETVAVKGPNGETFGWQSTVALVDERTGIEVARASMIAGLDDFPSQSSDEGCPDLGRQQGCPDQVLVGRSARRLLANAGR